MYIIIKISSLDWLLAACCRLVFQTDAWNPWSEKQIIEIEAVLKNPACEVPAHTIWC